MLLALNIADDYFKAKKLGDSLQSETENKDTAMYDLKHELIAAQIKLENTEKNMKDLQTDLNEDSKKIIQMETELKSYKKK